MMNTVEKEVGLPLGITIPHKAVIVHEVQRVDPEERLQPQLSDMNGST